jgi:hypothetical protein
MGTNEVEIKTINIKINKKELSLSIEEAKRLYELLNGLVGPKEVNIVSNPIIIQKTDKIDPYYPYYPGLPWQQPEITWLDNTDGFGEVTYTCNT